MREPALRHRLLWSGTDPRGEEAAPTPAVMARTFIYLYSAGATLVLITLALPHAEDWEPLRLIGPAIAAYIVAAAMLIGFDRYPMWVYESLPTGGTVLVTIVLLSGGSTAVVAYAALYFWVVLSAFYLFGRRWAFVNLLFVGVAYAAALLLSPSAQQRSVTWVMVMGALLVGGTLIGVLRDRVERLVGKLSDAYRRALESEAALAYAQSVAAIGSWELELRSGRVHLTRELSRILGEPTELVQLDRDAFLERVHPDDRHRVARAFADAAGGHAPFALDHRIVQPDGNVRMVHARGQLTGSRSRAPVLVGTVQDVTERTRQEELLRRTLQRLRATTEIAMALGRETELPDLLRLIAQRSAVLVSARSVLIFVIDGEWLTLAADAGEPVPGRRQRLPRSAPDALALLNGGVRRLAGGAVSDSLEPLGLRPDPAIIAPFTFRGRAEGLLVALDRTHDGPEFHGDDEELMRSFASSAATAVAGARSVAHERLRRAIDAAERERQHWARELHDQTLQGLGALRMRLDLALQQRSSETLEAAARDSLEQVAGEIDSLRRMISDLRPALLDDFGLPAAIDALAERIGQGHDLDVHARVDLPDAGLPEDVELSVFRIVQEALTNVVKHAAARSAEVEVGEDDGVVRICVSDDGIGFDPGGASEGFGLPGMNERVALLGGRLSIESRAGATTLTALIPLGERAPRRNGPGAITAPGPSKAETGEKRG